jgi:hypothetical protein
MLMVCIRIFSTAFKGLGMVELAFSKNGYREAKKTTGIKGRNQGKNTKSLPGRKAFRSKTKETHKLNKPS